MSSIGQRIKEIRDYYDLTQQQFADELGLKRNSVANYETGRNSPMDVIILSICRTWNISEDWLRSGEGKMLMKMDKEGEIMAFIGKTFADDKPSFTKEFIHVLSKLNVEEWELLEKIANLIAEEKNS
ncbi:MAG: helix-turn-helix domain-containing protein [Beduini sp.]|uniref:helix-turn-helix domain-containing protein n=1 Tax=Beduini sp. TaxID=1922300 RepID=UPI003990DFF9